MFEPDRADHSARGEIIAARDRRTSTRRSTRRLGRADVEVVAGPDNPHRHVRAQCALASQRSEPQLFRRPDPVQIFSGPDGHGRTITLIAWRSSIAR